MIGQVECESVGKSVQLPFAASPPLVKLESSAAHRAN